MPKRRAAPLAVRIRIVLPDGTALGPGKADLLERIREHGSIAAAGRTMAMSYQRAWTLVDAMNRAFREPLVVSTRGGSQRGGAELTPHGVRVLAGYRAAERAAGDGAADALAEIASLAKNAGSEISE